MALAGRFLQNLAQTTLLFMEASYLFLDYLDFGLLPGVTFFVHGNTCLAYIKFSFISGINTYFWEELYVPSSLEDLAYNQQQMALDHSLQDIIGILGVMIPAGLHKLQDGKKKKKSYWLILEHAMLVYISMLCQKCLPYFVPWIPLYDRCLLRESANVPTPLWSLHQWLDSWDIFSPAPGWETVVSRPLVCVCSRHL